MEHVISTELVALLLPKNTVSKKGLARRKARNSCGNHWLEAWYNALCVTGAIEAFPVMVNYTSIQQCTNSISKTKNFISSLHQKWRFFLFRHFRDWKLPNLPESFVFIATKILFFKYVLLYNITKKPEKIIILTGLVWIFRRKTGNWNPESFKKYFLWVIHWPRIANIITCFSNFLGGQKRLKQ